MSGIRTFLEEVLHLRVNETKSAVERPWKRKFLGYSVTAHRDTRLRIAPESLRRLANRVRELTREGRGCSLTQTLEELNPVLRGWMAYFRKTEAKSILEDFDAWVRRRLRCLLWRQWNRTWPRARRMIALGLAPERAWLSAQNGRGPWWNSGASHLHAALPASYFTRLGLVSLVATHRHLQCVATP